VKRGRPSAHTSGMEMALAKPLKPLEKISAEARSSGLSAAEKASATKGSVTKVPRPRGGRGWLRVCTCDIFC
jgi:hypothetical protein